MTASPATVPLWTPCGKGFTRRCPCLLPHYLGRQPRQLINFPRYRRFISHIGDIVGGLLYPALCWVTRVATGW
jgi:hypothetical protein